MRVVLGELGLGRGHSVGNAPVARQDDLVILVEIADAMHGYGLAHTAQAAQEAIEPTGIALTQIEGNNGVGRGWLRLGCRRCVNRCWPAARIEAFIRMRGDALMCSAALALASQRDSTGTDCHR